MVSVVQAQVALIGGSCALLAVLISIVAAKEIHSAKHQSRLRHPKEIRKTVLVGSVFFVLAAMLVALVDVIVGWAR